MKVSVLHNSKIDKIKWDETLLKSEHALIYANSWYLDIVCPDWHGVILDDYKAIFPLPFQKKYLLGLYLQPPFTQQFGVFSEYPLSETEFQLLAQSFPKNAVKVDLQFYHKLPHSSKIKEFTRNNIELNLHKTYTELYRAYSENTRRNIKKAADFTLKKTENIDEIIFHFKKNKSYSLNYKLLSSLYNSSRNKAEAFAAFDKNNEYLCGMLLFFFKNRSYYIFSSTSEAGRNSGAPQALIDYFIQLNAEKDVILDFEGSDDENLARFYLGFGGEVKPYYRYKASIL